MKRTIRPKLEIGVDRTYQYCYGCNWLTWTIDKASKCKLFNVYLSFDETPKTMIHRTKKCMEAE